MISWSPTYTGSSAAGACGATIGHDGRGVTAGRATPRDAGQLTTGSLAVTGAAVGGGVTVLGPDGPAADGADDADPLVTVGAPQPVTSINADSGAPATSRQRSRPR